MIKIRSATRQDMAQVLEIERLSEEDAPASVELLLERLEMFPQGFLVAEQNGNIVGYAESCLWNKHQFSTFEEIRNFSDHHDPKGKILFVIFVAVHPKQRQRGVGSQLVKELIALGERLNKECVQLIAKAPLAGLYRKLGFVEVRRLPGFLPSCDGVLMEYRLAQRSG